MKTIDLTKYVLSKDGIASKMIKPRAVPQEDGTVEYEGTDSVFFTIGKAFESALLSKNTLKDEPTIEEVTKRYDLFMRINNQESITLTASEITYIEELIIANYDIFFAGEIIDYLNNIK